MVLFLITSLFSKTSRGFLSRFSKRSRTSSMSGEVSALVICILAPLAPSFSLFAVLWGWTAQGLLSGLLSFLCSLLGYQSCCKLLFEWSVHTNFLWAIVEPIRTISIYMYHGYLWNGVWCNAVWLSSVWVSRRWLVFLFLGDIWSCGVVISLVVIIILVY